MPCLTAKSSPSIVAIGNAIVDKCFLISEETLSITGIIKGSMSLINQSQLDKLRKFLPPPDVVTPGGSVANTMIGLSLLGTSSGYIGRVAADDLGESFVDKISRCTLERICKVNTDTASTGTCIILITPDGERTMATYLGVCNQIITTPEEEIWAANAKILVLEGYLCEEGQTFESLYRVASLTKKNHNYVALTLGSTSCIQFNAPQMKRLLDDNLVDIILGTKAEGCALSNTQSLEDAIEFFQKFNCIGAFTDGAQGAYVFDSNTFLHIPAPKISQVVDTTGAGDQFAAGYLYGFLNQKSLEEIGYLGTSNAAKVLGIIGAHPQ